LWQMILQNTSFIGSSRTRVGNFRWLTLAFPRNYLVNWPSLPS
jgi:hypothetical protein